MVNILTPETQKALYRSYYFRLFGAFFFVLGVIVIVGAGLLTPSYFLVREEAASAERFRDALVETLELKGKNTATRSLSVLAEEVKLLNAYGKNDTATRIVRAALTAQNNDIILKKISFGFQEGKSGVVTLGGVAETRNALVSYVADLQKETLFSGVAVPVANLAAETDIDFALTFSFKTP